jgi:hypothetical protein
MSSFGTRAVHLVLKKLHEVLQIAFAVIDEDIIIALATDGEIVPQPRQLMTLWAVIGSHTPASTS